MNHQSPKFAREALAMAVAQFHVADHALRLHVRAWNALGPTLIPAIDRYWSVERVVPNPEWVPEQIRAEGENALALCAKAEKRKLELMDLRHQRLKCAFHALGAYYGSLMANDTHGSLVERFVRYLRPALAERKSSIDGKEVRLTTMLDLGSFELMASWVKALGYKKPQDFFRDVNLEIMMRNGSHPASRDQAIRHGIVIA